MFYMTFVLRSVFEVCNFEFGPFYNYPFFRVRLLAMSACVRSGPWHDHFLSSHYRNNWARRPRPGPVPVPLFAQFRHLARRHAAPSPFSRPGLSLPSNCRSDQLCSQEISQPKQGCYVRASAIRLHHLPSSELCASQCLSGPS